MAPRQVFGQTVDGRFAGSVGSWVKDVEIVGAVGRNIDDFFGAGAGLHQWDGRLATKKGTVEVHSHLLMECLSRSFAELLHDAATGIVDQHIDSTKSRHNGRK